MLKVKVWAFDENYTPVAHEFLPPKIKGPYPFVSGYEIYRLDFSSMTEFLVESLSGTVLGRNEAEVLDDFVTLKPAILVQRFKEGAALRDRARLISEREFWECVFLR